VKELGAGGRRGEGIPDRRLGRSLSNMDVIIGAGGRGGEGIPHRRLGRPLSNMGVIIIHQQRCSENKPLLTGV